MKHVGNFHCTDHKKNAISLRCVIFRRNPRWCIWTGQKLLRAGGEMFRGVHSVETWRNEILFAQHVKVAPGKINLIDSKVISGCILSLSVFSDLYSNKGWQKKGVWTKGEIMRKLIGCNTNTHTSVCSLDNSDLGYLVASLGCKECHWVP